jgi:SNF2 family DNA or RNA helicase
MSHLSGFESDDPTYKCVVFSQWTSMLHLVGSRLSSSDISWLKLDGSMVRSRRTAVMSSFSSDDSIRVLLVSLTAGNLGLNLTSANRVILLDPWWNPAVESQAVDRVHRVGQTRSVQVFKYVALDSVENRILDLQRRKREVFASAMVLGSEDLRSLF